MKQIKMLLAAALFFLLVSCESNEGAFYEDKDVLTFKPGDTIYVFSYEIKKAVVVANDKKAKIVEVNLLGKTEFENTRFFRYRDL